MDENAQRGEEEEDRWIGRNARRKQATMYQDVRVLCLFVFCCLFFWVPSSALALTEKPCITSSLISVPTVTALTLSLSLRIGLPFCFIFVDSSPSFVVPLARIFWSGLHGRASIGVVYCNLYCT